MFIIKYETSILAKWRDGKVDLREGGMVLHNDMNGECNDRESWEEEEEKTG